MYVSQPSRLPCPKINRHGCKKSPTRAYLFVKEAVMATWSCLDRKTQTGDMAMKSRGLVMIRNAVWVLVAAALLSVVWVWILILVK